MTVTSARVARLTQTIPKPVKRITAQEHDMFFRYQQHKLQMLLPAYRSLAQATEYTNLLQDMYPYDGQPILAAFFVRLEKRFGSHNSKFLRYQLHRQINQIVRLSTEYAYGIYNQMGIENIRVKQMQGEQLEFLMKKYAPTSHIFWGDAFMTHRASANFVQWFYMPAYRQQLADAQDAQYRSRPAVGELPQLYKAVDGFCAFFNKL